MKTRELILAGLLAAIIAVMAPWSLPLPLVPITLQTLIIPIVASIANTKISLAAIVVYLLFGIVGLPVFAGGASGLAVMFGPTGGYLWGMLVFPLIISSLLAQQRNLATLIGANLLAAIIQLAIGAGWLVLASKGMDWQTGLTVGMLAFIVPAIIKVALVTMVTVMIARSMKLPLQ